MLWLIAAASAQETDDRDVSWYALPTVDYTSDTGIGFGLSGGLYFEQAGLMPYKSAIELDLYATTKRIQYHSLWFEIVQLADRPIRLQGGLGFTASVSDSYCGVAGDPDCDSEATASESYYLQRYSAPTASLTALVQPARWPVGLVVGGYGARYRPGVFEQDTPYPGSLYSASFPEGETGLYSGVMLGLLRDTRDNEFSPSRGGQSDASLRGGSVLTGSQWDHLGTNLTLTGYLPLHPTLTSASRLVFDRVWGELPSMELGTFGGWSGGSGLGGDIGRGIRAGRYLGRLKALGQQELRWMPLSLSMWNTPVDVGGVAFFDAGHVADAGTGVSAWGTGGGIRIDINSDFLVRFDMGFSPVESWQPYSYIGHAF